MAPIKSMRLRRTLPFGSFMAIPFWWAVNSSSEKFINFEPIGAYE